MWANDITTREGIWPTQATTLDKQAFSTLLPGARQVSRKTSFLELSPAVLDSEWSQLASTQASITPDPYEDLDQPFVHSKWLLEVNTTRRSDHNSKYRVLWGPFLLALSSGRLGKEGDAQSLGGAIGPTIAGLVPTRVAQSIALYSNYIFPYRGSSGLLPTSPTSIFGEVYLSRAFGAILTQGLVPEASVSTATSHATYALGARSVSQLAFSDTTPSQDST